MGTHIIVTDWKIFSEGKKKKKKKQDLGSTSKSLYAM
jgi:hypothetical protein